MDGTSSGESKDEGSGGEMEGWPSLRPPPEGLEEARDQIAMLEPRTWTAKHHRMGSRGAGPRIYNN